MTKASLIVEKFSLDALRSRRSSVLEIYNRALFIRVWIHFRLHHITTETKLYQKISFATLACCISIVLDAVSLQYRRLFEQFANGHIPAKKAKQIIDWLSPLSFADRQNEVLSRRCEGTGQWFLESPQVSTWLSGSDKSSLWCSGIPGKHWFLHRRHFRLP